MDLIYMSADREDIGVMNDYTFDLAYGSEENDFECKIVRSNHCCEEGFFLYYEGTEYGGIVDDIGVDTEADEVTYYGRTWHGILNSKVLAPDAGEDYLIVSGEVNKALGSLIARLDLSDLFIASTEDSGITIPSYQMNRYIEGYDGIKKMLKASGLKLNMVFKNGFVELSAKPIVDYSKDDQFDKDQTAFVVNQKGHPINHVICLGKGDLAEREVIHVYADRSGKISETQVFTGIEEVVAIYENTNAEDSEKLKQGGIDIIKEAWASDEVDVTFNFDDENFDIGDIVGADDAEIGVVVRKEITKKIVSIKNGEATVSYPTDNSGKTSTSSRGGGSSGGSDNPSTGGGTANLVEIFEVDYENLSDIEKNDETTAYFVPDGSVDGDDGVDVGDTDISGIGDGTITGAIGALASDVGSKANKPVNLGKIADITAAANTYTKVTTVSIPAKSFYTFTAFPIWYTYCPTGVRICSSDNVNQALAWQEQSSTAPYMVSATVSGYADKATTFYVYAKWNGGGLEQLHIQGFYIPSV